jgi:Ser/Thr protein kinase RdoA (MazF antagonist)
MRGEGEAVGKVEWPPHGVPSCRVNSFLRSRDSVPFAEGRFCLRRLRWLTGMMTKEASAACREVLQRYRAILSTEDVRDAPLIACGGGFSGARVVRVEAAGQSWCLRRWPERSLPVPRLHELHRWLRFLRERGELPVAVPVPGPNGDSLLERNGRWWQLEPWLPGRSDDHERPSGARLCSAMQTLARLHETSREYQTTPEGRDWFTVSHGPSPAVRVRLQILEAHPPGGLRELATDLARLHGSAAHAALEALILIQGLALRVQQRLAAWQQVKLPLFPCLRDVWRDHVLFSGEEVTGLIDSSAARSESAASDLARLLGSLIGNDDEAWDVALAAYSERRPLADDERHFARVLDTSGVVLSGLTWAERLVAGQAAPDDVRVEQRLRGIIGRMQHIERRGAVDFHG